MPPCQPHILEILQSIIEGLTIGDLIGIYQPGSKLFVVIRHEAVVFSHEFRSQNFTFSASVDLSNLGYQLVLAVMIDAHEMTDVGPLADQVRFL